MVYVLFKTEAQFILYLWSSFVLHFHFLSFTLGTNLTFIELLNSVQRGTILKEINVGPIRVKGDVIGR